VPSYEKPRVADPRAAYLSPGWLKTDATFDTLRGNPRFQSFVAGAK